MAQQFPPPPPASAPTRGFLARLFDLSFTEFITPSIVKLIFIIGIIVSAIYALFILVAAGASGSGAIFFLGLIFSVFFFFISVLWSRVAAEIAVIFFRIEENTRR